MRGPLEISNIITDFKSIKINDTYFCSKNFTKKCGKNILI